MGDCGMTRIARAALLAVIAALALPLSHNGLLADDTAPQVKLAYEVLADKDGNITGVAISGEAVPSEYRGGTAMVTLRYADIFAEEDFAMGMGDSASVGKDGTFRVQFGGDGRSLFNQGAWRALVKIKSPAGDPPIEQEINPVVVGTQAGKDRQCAMLNVLLETRLKVYLGVRGELDGQAELLGKLGLTKKKFMLEQEEMKPHLRQFLLLLHSIEGRDAAKQPLSAQGLEPLPFPAAMLDMERLGQGLPGDSQPPYFMKYIRPRIPGPDGTAQDEKIAGSVNVSVLKGLDEIFRSLASAYKGLHASAAVTVAAKDAAAAVRDLRDGKADMIALDRPLTAAEQADCVKARGFAPLAVRLGVKTSVAVIVNAENPIEEISVPQVDAIFSKTGLAGFGKDITAWGHMGLEDERWKNRAIRVVVPRGAPALEAFRSVALMNGEMKRDVVEAASVEAVLAEVQKDPFAIGFCPVDALNPGVRALNILNGQMAVAPSADSIEGGVYPLTAGACIYLCLNPGWRNMVNEMMIAIAASEERYRTRPAPWFVADFTGGIETHFAALSNILGEYARQLELNLTDIDVVFEARMQDAVNAKYAEGVRGTPAEVRGIVEREIKAQYGSIENARKTLEKMLIEDLAKAGKNFEEEADVLRARIARESDVTVANLYEDVISIYRYYWELCDGYQASLKEFNPKGWMAVWQDRVTAAKDTFRKYVPGYGARNVGATYKDLDKQLTAAFDEMLNLRGAFLKKLYEKHGTAEPNREPLAGNIRSLNEHAAAVKRIYIALCAIVTPEVEKHLPPFKAAFDMIEGKFSAIRDYMEPAMPGKEGRKSPSQAEVHKWVSEVYSPAILAETEKSAARFAAKEFHDLFPNVSDLHQLVLTKMILLGNHYEAAVTMRPANDAERTDLERQITAVKSLSGAIEAMLGNIRAMIEDKYDLSGKAIFTPDEKGYQDRYAETPPRP